MRNKLNVQIRIIGCLFVVPVVDFFSISMEDSDAKKTDGAMSAAHSEQTEARNDKEQYYSRQVDSGYRERTRRRWWMAASVHVMCPSSQVECREKKIRMRLWTHL